MSKLYFHSCTYHLANSLIIIENIIVRYDNMIKNIKSIFTNDYNNIIDRIDKFKYEKTNFIYDEFNKNLKYIDYALEECLSSEKILITISNISKYDIILDKMVVKLINGNLQKHIVCISTCINNKLYKLENNIINKFSRYCLFDYMLSGDKKLFSNREFMYFIVKYKYKYEVVVFGENDDFNDIAASSFLFNYIIYMLVNYVNINDSKRYKYCFDDR